MTQRNIEKTVKMPHMGLSGYVRLSVINSDGSVAWESGFANLILDQGLDEIAARPIAECMEHCAVGTGNSAPANTQVELDNEIARTNNYLTGLNNCQTSFTPEATTPAVIKHRRTFDFPQGTLDSGVDGDYQEVGFSWTGTAGQNLFARALIRDDQGTVVTVSVASDQILRVQYDLSIDFSPVEASATPAGVSTSFNITNIGTINGVHLIQTFSGDNTASNYGWVTDDEGNNVIDPSGLGFNFDDSYAQCPINIIRPSDGGIETARADNSPMIEPYTGGSNAGIVLLDSSFTDYDSLEPHFQIDAASKFDQYSSFPFEGTGESGVAWARQAYSAGAFSVVKQAVFDVGNANFEIAHILIAGENLTFTGFSGSGRERPYHFIIDSADRFTKANTHTLTINMLFSWGRA